MRRVMVFIDGNNFEKAVNTLNGKVLKLDYEKLAQHLAGTHCRGDLVRFYFYTAQGDPKRDPAKHAGTQKFIENLKSKSKRCIVRVGRLQHHGKDFAGKDIFEEKETDVNIATDMISLAYNNAYDIAVLASADSDYSPVINLVRQLGKVVILCAVDGQKAGFMKQQVDEDIILTGTELNGFIRP